MEQRHRQRSAWMAALVLFLTLVAGVAAELADVYLKSGARLRGDVTATETEVIIRNELGEARFPRDEVERIVPAKAATQPAGEGEPTSAPAQEESAEDAGDEGVPVNPNVPGVVGPPAEPLDAPPLLSELDIQRLKLYELRLDGAAETLRVRFAGADQRELPREILEVLKTRPDYVEHWEEVLLRGSPSEKLQLIVRTTGVRYADRINVANDPEVFTEFRQRVLPIVQRGCARSGCHQGADAVTFRFPDGPKRGDEVLYTTFYLLDQTDTPQGRLIDRDDPDGSALLGYMLPQEDNHAAHPPVEGKRKFVPVLRHRNLPGYEIVRNWINALRAPHPKYELDYTPPMWLRTESIEQEKGGGLFP